MEVLRTVARYKKRARALCTAKVSAGHLYEVAALGYCRAHSWQVVRRNWYLGKAEIDLLVKSPAQELILLEVRGRNSARYLPRQMISQSKVRRLQWLSEIVARRYQKRTTIVLLEVIGKLPTPWAIRLIWWLLLRFCPEALGIRFWALAVQGR